MLGVLARDEPTTRLRTRILVVDDHRTFADLLALAFTAEPDLECVGTARTITECITLTGSLRPDLVVMDVQLADGDGLDATAQLTALFPALLVVVLTAFVSSELMRRAADAGACALLTKDGALTEMLEAVRSAHPGGFVVQPALLHRLVRQPSSAERAPLLTQREQDVLRLLATAADTRQIAKCLDISLSTCRGYIKRLLVKLDAHSQLEAVVVARRYGLI